MCSSVNPIKQDPPWSPEEHLERTIRRGRQLRRRRQVGTSAAALVAVVGLAVGIAGSTSPVFHPLQVLTGTNGGGSDAVKTQETTTSTKADDNVAPDDDHTSTTRSGRAAASPTKQAASPTTTVASGSVVQSGGSTGNTPPTSPLTDCKAGDLRYFTATNKTSYRAGDTVDISLRARNASDHPCYAPSACSAEASATVQRESDGATVYQSSPHLVGCTRPATQPLLNPGDVQDYGVVGSWNQGVCSGSATDGCSGERSPVGTYTATAKRGSTAASSATFALR